MATTWQSQATISREQEASSALGHNEQAQCIASQALVGPLRSNSIPQMNDSHTGARTRSTKTQRSQDYRKAVTRARLSARPIEDLNLAANVFETERQHLIAEIASVKATVDRMNKRLRSNTDASRSVRTKLDQQDWRLKAHRSTINDLADVHRREAQQTKVDRFANADIQYEHEEAWLRLKHELIEQKRDLEKEDAEAEMAAALAELEIKRGRGCMNFWRSS